MSDNKYVPCNNQFQNCPAIMSDGRNFTDYRPINHVNNLLIANNNIENHYSYREFLIQNAEKLIDMNRNLMTENNKCDQCTDTTKDNNDKLNESLGCEKCNNGTINI